jgi:hypothetical protein
MIYEKVKIRCPRVFRERTREIRDGFAGAGIQSSRRYDRAVASLLPGLNQIKVLVVTCTSWNLSDKENIVMEQIRCLMILMAAGTLVWLSYVLFSYGIDQRESLTPLSSLTALAIDLIFLIKFGRPNCSLNTDADVPLTKRYVE